MMNSATASVLACVFSMLAGVAFAQPYPVGSAKDQGNPTGSPSNPAQSNTGQQVPQRSAPGMTNDIYGGAATGNAGTFSGEKPNLQNGNWETTGYIPWARSHGMIPKAEGAPVAREKQLQPMNPDIISNERRGPML